MSGAVRNYPSNSGPPNDYRYQRHSDGHPSPPDMYHPHQQHSNRNAAPPPQQQSQRPPMYAPQPTYGGGTPNNAPAGLGILSASQHRDAEIFHLKHENEYPSVPENAEHNHREARSISATSMPWKSPGMSAGVPSMEDRVWGGVMGITRVPANEEAPEPRDEVRAPKRKKSDKSSAEAPKPASRRASKASSTASRGRKTSTATRATSEEKSSSEDENADKDDDLDKRQRGRPRLETKDETAADRRRTQIRLAQRAYRQRKETTIVSLKKRVTELETTIDNMHKSFLELHDAAVNLHVVESVPQFGHVLRTITEKFITMAKDAGKGALSLDDDEDMKPTIIPEEGSSLKNNNSNNNNSTTSTSTSTSNGNNTNKRKRSPEPPTEEPADRSSRSSSTPHSAPPDVQPASSISDAPGPDSKWLNDMDLGSMGGHLISSTVITQSPAATETSLVRKPNATSMNNTMNYSFDNPLLNREFLAQQLFAPSVPPPMSVSEMTRHHDFKFPPIADPIFASRLGMNCLRYGFTLLHHPNSDPIDVMRAFAYGMLFSEKEELKHRVAGMLRRKPGDPPVGLDFPVQNLGGSGLHFTFKRDSSGRMVKVAPGPREMDKVNNKNPAVLRMQLAKMGFANDAWKIIPIILEAEERGFFNPPDVEAWLMDKGVQLTPYSPTVTVPAGIIDNSLIHPARSPSRNSNDQFSLNEEDFVNTNTNDFLNDVMANAANFVDGADYGYGVNPMMSSSPGSSGNHNQSVPDRHSPANNNSPVSSYGNTPFAQNSYGANMYPATKTLNVDTFIRELVKRCTCLGNVPGWQQSDVETCLMLATS